MNNLSEHAPLLFMITASWIGAVILIWHMSRDSRRDQKKILKIS